MATGQGKVSNAPERESEATPRVRTFTAFGLQAEGQKLDPGLHVVATPIGNLGDVSLRALGTLAAADVVIAEDTRVTRTLLAHYGITTPLVAYHEHNAEVMRPHLLARLAAGGKLALVSDAGTPLVSDPGFKLVAEAVAAGAEVTSVPGASAVLAALVVAGLPTDRFYFEGFLPQKSAARRGRIGEIAAVPGTLVFFESPRRLAEMLADLAMVLGDREAAIARELTKLYENVRRGRLQDLAAQYAAEDPPRGEIVVLVAPPSGDIAVLSADDIDARLREAMQQHSAKDAASLVAAQTGMKRREVYARAIVLGADGRDDGA